MKYEELLKTEDYWVTRIQSLLYKGINDYLKSENISKSAFAKQIGVSKGYVTQVLNGNFDHKVSTLVKLVLAIQKIPDFSFISLDEFLFEQNVKVEQTQKVSLKNLKGNYNKDNTLLLTPNWANFHSSEEQKRKLTFNVNH